MSDQLFLRWNLVVHVAKNLPRTVCLFFPDKQFFAAEMDLLGVPRYVPFEQDARNRDVTHHMEAVPVSRKRERDKLWVGEEALVILADRSLPEYRLLLLRQKDRLLVVKVRDRGGVFLVLRCEPLLITILHRGLDLGFVVILRQHGQGEKQHECEWE